MTNIFATWWWTFPTLPVWKNFLKNILYKVKSIFLLDEENLHDEEYFCYIVKKFYDMMINIFLCNEKHFFTLWKIFTYIMKNILSRQLKIFLSTIWEKINMRVIFLPYAKYFSIHDKSYFSTWWNMIKIFSTRQKIFLLHD